MKNVVSGGTGLTGRYAVKDWLKVPEVSDIVMTIRSLKKVQRIA